MIYTLLYIYRQECNLTFNIQHLTLLLHLLHIVQFLIISVFAYQFIVSTTLHDSSLMHHADFVCMLDSAQAVSHGYGSTGLHQFLQSILHQALALCIKSRSSLVENEDRRILEDGTGDAYTLALTTGKSASTVADSMITS